MGLHGWEGYLCRWEEQASFAIIMRSNQQLKPELIIGYCQENFINILPSAHSEQPSIMPRDCLADDDHVKEIMGQLSLFLQLTIQNCVLTSDPKVKSHSIRILGKFRDLLSRDLDDFENLIYHRNRTKLPFYEVDCKEFLGRDLMVRIPPQVSLYQDPLLFYNYSRLAQEQLFCNLSIMKTREERIQILKSHVPFLNPYFIPIVGERLETKAKFSELEDRLLLILLNFHEKKDISHFKYIYFPNRQESTIRNRAKNLCAKEMVNPVKKMRQNQYLPLTPEETRTIVRGFMRFGVRWPVISKYYRVRSGTMLEAEYDNSPKLDKIRKTYNIGPSGPSLRETIEKQMSREGDEDEEVQPESERMEAEQENSELESEEPIYKIINHLTFLYEEI